jgi:GNAT superfamily N-acetyltransferase
MKPAMLDNVPVSASLILVRYQAGQQEAIRAIVAGAFDSQLLGDEVAHTLECYSKSGRADLELDQQTTEPLPTEYWTLIDVETKWPLGLCGLYRFAWAWEKSFWLGWFAVSSELHGQGLGTAMLQTLFQIARSKGCEVFKVETGRGSKATQFYKKMGFTEEGTLSRHYSQTLDATVLSRDLSDIEPL